jgi:hypothetical protein
MPQMQVTVAVAPHNPARHKIANILKALLVRAKALRQRGGAPKEVAFSLRSNHDKTLLFQAVAVEIDTPLDYYPGPDSAGEANRGGSRAHTLRAVCWRQRECFVSWRSVQEEWE